jgi:hypothetical protein
MNRVQDRANIQFNICRASAGYDIYRDGTLIASGVDDNFYIDENNEFDYSQPHTWTVIKICDNGQESDPIEVTLDGCKQCLAPENLFVEYDEDCCALISWDEMAKKAGKKGISGPRETTPGSGKPEGAIITADVSPLLGKAPVVGSAPKAMWDVVSTFSAYSPAQPAIATDGNYWYTANWNGGYSQFVRYNMNGTNPTPFTISGVPSEFRSLTYDGTIFYGGTASSTIYKLDLANQTSLGTINAGGTARHLCYDPTLDGGNGGFWHGDWTNIRAITMTGTQIYASVAVDDVYGSAYDPHSNPGTPYLWLFAQNGAHYTTLHQFDCTTRTFTGVTRDVYNDIPYTDGSQSAGGAFAYQNGATYYLAVNVQFNYDENTIIVYELANTNPNIAAAPNPFTVTPAGTALKANLSWKNPSTTVGGAPLAAGSISKMVILRDGSQVHEITSGIVVGGNMNWSDNNVPTAGNHCYSVYAVTSEGDGVKAGDCDTFGDMCNITFEMWDDYGDGWNSGTITIKVDGVSVGSVGLPSGAYGMVDVLIPSGALELVWNPGSYDCECEFAVYHANGDEIYHSPANGSFPCSTPGVGMYGISGTFFTTDYICGGGAVTYNLYCDGE